MIYKKFLNIIYSIKILIKMIKQIKQKKTTKLFRYPEHIKIAE